MLVWFYFLLLLVSMLSTKVRSSSGAQLLDAMSALLQCVCADGWFNLWCIGWPMHHRCAASPQPQTNRPDSGDQARLLKPATNHTYTHSSHALLNTVTHQSKSPISNQLWDVSRALKTLVQRSKVRVVSSVTAGQLQGNKTSGFSTGLETFQMTS